MDHLYAVKVIGEVHEKGGQVLEFYSYCGGLPALEAANNPLKFKVGGVSSPFRTSCFRLTLLAYRTHLSFRGPPRGALLSQYNSATFFDKGELVHIPNKDLMAKSVPYFVLDGYSSVAYPNSQSPPWWNARTMEGGKAEEKNFVISEQKFMATQQRNLNKTDGPSSQYLSQGLHQPFFDMKTFGI